MATCVPLPPRRERGFTLVEALVVLAIVGLVAGLSYPAVEKMRVSLALRHARGQVSAAAEGARVAALRQGAPAALAASRDGSTLSLDDGRTFALGGAGLVRVEMMPARIWFYPDGSASGGAIRLRAPDGVTTTLIAPDTGAVRPGGAGDA